MVIVQAGKHAVLDAVRLIRPIGGRKIGRIIARVLGLERRHALGSLERTAQACFALNDQGLQTQVNSLDCSSKARSAATDDAHFCLNGLIGLSELGDGSNIGCFLCGSSTSTGRRIGGIRGISGILGLRRASDKRRCGSAHTKNAGALEEISAGKIELSRGVLHRDHSLRCIVPFDGIPHSSSLAAVSRHHHSV